MLRCVMFSLHSHDGTDSPADSDDIVVVLNNFKSRIVKVKVSSPVMSVTHQAHHVSKHTWSLELTCFDL